MSVLGKKVELDWDNLKGWSRMGQAFGTMAIAAHTLPEPGIAPETQKSHLSSATVNTYEAQLQNLSSFSGEQIYIVISCPGSSLSQLADKPNQKMPNRPMKLSI